VDKFQEYLEEQVTIGKKLCKDILSSKDLEMYRYWMHSTDAYEMILKNYVKFLNDQSTTLF